MANDNFISLHCFGCGVELQNEDPNKPGFIPKTLFKDSHFLCQRCFRLQHYNEDCNDKPIFNDYTTIINDAKKYNDVIIYVVDLFSFESSIIPSVIKELKDIPFVVLANKRDTIPSAVSDKKFEYFIFKRFEELGLKPKEIIIASATKNYNIDYLVERYGSKHKSIYLIGATSVGKSALINAYLKNFTNKTNELISTSPFPNTTLNVIKIPLGDGRYLYDTPGILVENSIFNKLDKKLTRYVLPRKEIKPRTYQLNEKQSLIINNLCRIDFVGGSKTSFTVFASNDLEVTRTKLDNADKVFANLIANKQFKLLDRNIKTIDDLQDHTFTLPQNEVDISVSGLLWVKIKGNNQTIKIYAPKGVLVSSRGCKI